MSIFNPGYYTENDLMDAGFKSIGENVCIAKNCTIVGCQNITIANDVRIDGYTTISAVGGFLTLGSNIHISGYCFLSAGAGITVADFCALSQGTKIYSKTDDFSGEFMTNPTVPKEFTGVIHGKVTIEKHVIIGSGSVVLPSATIGEGVAVGASSLVTRNLDSWGIYAGTPAKKIKNRSKNILALEKKMNEHLSQKN